MSSSLARKRDRTRQEARERQVKQFVRFGAFTAIVAVVIVAIVYFLAPVFAPKESGITQNVNAKVINLQAAMDGFDLQEIRVKVGETVKVNLRSLDNEHHTDGAGKHQFAIEELGVNIVAQPLSVASGTFVASTAGTFTYYCDICCGGKANPTMNGKLIVEG
ncbi:MAG: cupredoxin domain-containing protein [Chloroflexota bacterium]|nr:cupredoxin domain-containing protein [Chloroflexota bacterium]